MSMLTHRSMEPTRRCMGLTFLGGVTYSIKPAGQRKFLVLTKRNGSVLTQGSLELSDDGRILTDAWWNPDRPTDKSTLVYEKK